MSSKKNTVFITGASSGIGKATARFFSSRGWNVAATMRQPEKETELQNLPGVKLFALDVLDEKSIEKSIEAALNSFGSIEVVVNNAGYALVGAFEAMSKEQLTRQFDTNVIGLMMVTQKILPHFRSKKSGCIVNVTSMGGRITFPLFSAYHGTKWAVEGFAESLQFELKPLGIRVKNIEPGAIKTDFYERSLDFVSKSDYDKYVLKARETMMEFGRKAMGPEKVAQLIFKAANDKSYKLRYPIGSGAPVLLFLRWLLPLSVFNTLVAWQVEK
ncbi:MAG: SDR family oxidoreductase [Cytophagaceae bacterium]|jgi:NAD(P)-dependent dehydrogenase (short-subunit alcohol dehydrogenase family)|nr:SDR family oxidoreductase [Cytophagaceae bacterium]